MRALRQETPGPNQDPSEALAALEEEQKIRARHLRPRMTCCADAMAGVIADTDGDTPKWFICIEVYGRSPNQPPTYQRRAISICPWCGTHVPGFELAMDPAEHYARHEHGFCMECVGAAPSCFCLPSICAWKPAPPRDGTFTPLSTAVTVQNLTFRTVSVGNANSGPAGDNFCPSESVDSSRKTSPSNQADPGTILEPHREQ